MNETELKKGMVLMLRYLKNIVRKVINLMMWGRANGTAYKQTKEVIKELANRQEAALSCKMAVIVPTTRLVTHRARLGCTW